MSFRDRTTFLEDILESIELITEFLDGVTFASYQADHKTRLAVERLLQNLTEAAYRLGPDAEHIGPGIDWRSIRGLGNVLRHEYDDIDDAIVWDAIQIHLPPLKVAAQTALLKLSKSSEGDPS